MRFKLIILLVIGCGIFGVKGKIPFGKVMSMVGPGMKAVKTLTSKVAPPAAAPPQQPTPQPQMGQPGQQIPGQEQYQQMPYQQPVYQQQMYQQPPQIPSLQQMMEPQPSGQAYPIQRTYNPKEDYKEFYDKEYQDRLNQLFKRLTRIPNFLLSRKERRLLEKMKHRLCQEEAEELEDIRGIDLEEQLYDDEVDMEEHPKGYKYIACI
jgi:hypothetical protein